MKLTITTPTAIVVDTEAVSVRAEDETGGFGILPGHADFVTALGPSVVSWREAKGGPWRHAAVERGVFTVIGGAHVAVATRDAVVGESLATLEGDIVAAFARRADAERAERTAGLKLQMKAIRQIVAHLGTRPDAIMGGSA
ncbi:F0F1 ATP synthase subunit epsilon [Acuticoccus yangtzensis]|uniref:F0F1 ATP synthase subunit epsilon n=1 Tax=Acuticoccus yangtzensis TaxID=1443441 RepID=UPI0009499D20|nr:F0F1 ATP synthase subunit epsilon [Acuticoccus yangtzensis]